MKKITEVVKRSFQENPIATVAVGAAAVVATAKLIDAIGGAAGSFAYARQVNHRVSK